MPILDREEFDSMKKVTNPSIFNREHELIEAVEVLSEALKTIVRCWDTEGAIRFLAKKELEKVWGSERCENEEDTELVIGNGEA